MSDSLPIVYLARHGEAPWTITMSGTEPVMRHERPAPILGSDAKSSGRER